MKKILYILVLFLFSCNLPDNTEEYNEGLVVFGSLEIFENGTETISSIDTIHVSMSSSFNSNISNADSLYINDAIIKMHGYFSLENDTDTSTIMLSQIGLGKYLPEDNNYKIWPNKDYNINVKYNSYEVNASTTTPSAISISSIEDTYNCAQCSDPTIFGETTCENQGGTWNSELQNIDTININNYNTINSEIGGDWLFEPDLLDPYIETGLISSIELSRFGCKVGSFASMPYFNIEFETDNEGPSTKRILTYGLEAKQKDLEPLNQDGTFFDYNENGFRDETLINTFYDTTFVFKVWIGPYQRDEDYNPYLENPHIWTVETSPSPIMWLYFKYYGKNLMVIELGDNAYYDYLSGDPLAQNMYILPDSNIEGGYGLFTSRYSKPFFINVNKAD